MEFQLLLLSLHHKLSSPTVFWLFQKTNNLYLFDKDAATAAASMSWDEFVSVLLNQCYKYKVWFAFCCVFTVKTPRDVMQTESKNSFRYSILHILNFHNSLECMHSTAGKQWSTSFLSVNLFQGNERFDHFSREKVQFIPITPVDNSNIYIFFASLPDYRRLEPIMVSGIEKKSFFYWTIF